MIVAGARSLPVVKLSSGVDFRDLSFFVAVSEELHFARAAERLNIVPASVSQRIRDLEKELGLVLFDRTSRRVRLTPAGAALLDPARKALAGLGDVRSLAESLVEGTAGRSVLVFAPNGGPFASIALAAIAGAHPDIELVGRSMWGLEAIAAIDAGEAQAGVVRGPVSHPGLESVVLGTYDDGHLALPEDHPLAASVDVSITALQDLPMLIVERDEAPNIHDATLDYFRRHGVQPQWRRHRMQDYEQQMTLVAAGVASTLVHSHAATRTYSGVVVLPLVEPAPRYEMVLVWRRSDDSSLVRTLRTLAAAGRLS